MIPNLTGETGHILKVSGECRSVINIESSDDSGTYMCCSLCMHAHVIYSCHYTAIEFDISPTPSPLPPPLPPRLPQTFAPDMTTPIVLSSKFVCACVMHCCVVFLGASTLWAYYAILKCYFILLCFHTSSYMLATCHMHTIGNKTTHKAHNLNLMCYRLQCSHL